MLRTGVGLWCRLCRCRVEVLNLQKVLATGEPSERMHAAVRACEQSSRHGPHSEVTME